MDLPTLEGQMELNTKLAELSKDTGIPLIVTRDSHYLDPEDAGGGQSGTGDNAEQIPKKGRRRIGPPISRSTHSCDEVENAPLRAREFAGDSEMRRLVAMQPTAGSSGPPILPGAQLRRSQGTARSEPPAKSICLYYGLGRSVAIVVTSLLEPLSSSFLLNS